MNLFCTTIVSPLAFFLSYSSSSSSDRSFLPETNKFIFQQRQPVAAATAVMAVRSELS
jgi:hypothetical protein